jgi:hypothetical protein
MGWTARISSDWIDLLRSFARCAVKRFVVANITVSDRVESGAIKSQNSCFRPGMNSASGEYCERYLGLRCKERCNRQVGAIGS